MNRQQLAAQLRTALRNAEELENGQLRLSLTSLEWSQLDLLLAELELQQR